MISMMNKTMEKKPDMGTSKGVGGYRPQVNWKEISVKKKRTADKQIIGCILGSGFFLIILGLVITILGFFVIGTLCPFEWSSRPSGCMYDAIHNHTFVAVRSFCSEQGTGLPVILSQEANDDVANTITGPTWLALHRRKFSRVFKWPDGKTATFTNGWNPGSIDVNTTGCIVIDTDGTWRNEDCDSSAYALCMMKPSYNPFVLVGPVLILSGFAVLILSIEVCERRREFMRKNPEINSDEETLSSDTGSPTKENKVADAGIVNPAYNDGIQSAWADALKEIDEKPSPNYPRSKKSVLTVVPATLQDDPKKESGNEQSITQDQLELLLSPKNL